MDTSNENCGVNNYMKKRVVCYGILVMGASVLLGAMAIRENNIAKTLDTKNLAAGVNLVVAEDNNQATTPEDFTPVDMEVTPASVKKTPIEIYDSMSLAEREAALYAGTLHLEYSGLYTYSGDRLSVSKGAQYYNGHKETYYSQRVLPGTSLNIPGRHVAEDGTVRDGDGYICVAADPAFKAKGSVLITSLGPAKVYDSGCAYGVIDLYVNW